MKELKEKLLGEIEEFREKGHKFLNKELSVMDFKHASGGMGVYAERSRNTFMIRFRTPSGIISFKKIIFRTFILQQGRQYNFMDYQ